MAEINVYLEVIWPAIVLSIIFVSFFHIMFAIRRFTKGDFRTLINKIILIIVFFGVAVLSCLFHGIFLVNSLWHLADITVYFRGTFMALTAISIAYFAKKLAEFAEEYGFNVPKPT